MHAQSILQHKRVGQELASMRMHPTEKVSAYLDRSMGITAQCVAVGKIVPEEELIFYTPEGLPATIQGIVRISQRDADLTFEDMRVKYF